jgi:hypothetical protein
MNPHSDNPQRGALQRQAAPQAQPDSGRGDQNQHPFVGKFQHFYGPTNVWLTAVCDNSRVNK